MAHLTRSFWLSFALAAALGGGVLAAGAAATVALLDPPLQRFRTTVFSMQLPAGWNCELEQTEYVCRKGEPPYPSIAVIAMKQRNGSDNLEAYEAHLSHPAVRTNDDGSERRSRLVSLNRVMLGGVEWVNGLHDGSEVPNFLTRYLATATSHIAVLVTFSASKRVYDREVRDLDILMQSLTIHQKRAAP